MSASKRFEGYAAIAVVSFGAAVAWWLAGYPLSAGAMSLAGAIWTASALQQWRKNHGSNRRAEAGSQDPNPGPYTTSWDPGSFTTTGAFAAISSGTRPDLTPPKPRLEVVESDQPILAQRAARLIFHGNSHHWASLNQGTTFGVDANAHCNLRSLYRRLSDYGSNQHESPAVDCKCGFYAVPCDIEPWAEDGAYVTLLVELSGTIIEHEKGYRAGHQRVMECRIPPCRFCGAVAAVVDVRENAMASACCEAHTPTATDQVLVSLDDLRNLLPVPVTAAGRTENDEAQQ